METSKRIPALQRLLDQSVQVTTRNSSDPTFKTWKNTVERTLIRVFGDGSPEVQHFKQLRFFYQAIMMTLGADYSREHQEAFERDFQIIIASLKNYIEELQQEQKDDSAFTVRSGERTILRVFISHAAADFEIVEELVELLEIVGLTHEQIFCTSFAGYGIELGDDFLDAIRSELLNADALVLFVLTQRFYASPVCLCEMGATWVLAKEHIPVLVPPFEFDNIKGVIPLTQGFKINDPFKLNLFKQKIETVFGITSELPHAAWERKRDRVLDRINAKIAAGAGRGAT